jgi:ribosomal protein L11 methylase PrmA
MLGEHVIAHEADWNTVNSSSSGGGGGGGGDGGATVLELGAGTGLCGIMVGKATKSQVTITDLPELEELMDDNVRRNFGPSVDDDSLLSEEERKLLTYLDSGKAKGTVTSRVLRWGVEEDYFLDNSNRKEQENQQPYDVIIGADIVASLYDPVALAQTIYALCGPTTKIYISSKSRLDRPHETFDVEMARLFEKVEKKVCVCSRLKSPNVFIIQAEGKRDKIEC